MVSEASRSVAPTCRTEVIVDASVEAVWRVVADVTRTSEWSHECHRVTWLRVATTAAPGARFRGHNRSGRLREPGLRDRSWRSRLPTGSPWRTIATLVFPDSTDWTIALEPVGARTRVVQTCQMRNTPRWFRWIAGVVVPMHLDRSGALADDLRRIGTDRGPRLGGRRGATMTLSVEGQRTTPRVNDRRVDEQTGERWWAVDAPRLVAVLHAGARSACGHRSERPEAVAA